MIFLLIAFMFSLVVAVFSIQNSISVTVNLFYWAIQTSLVVVVIGSALCGFLIALSVSLFKYVGVRFQLSKANTQIKELNLKMDALQNERIAIPVKVQSSEEVTATKPLSSD
ncbi:MAG: hypothetical protein K0R78_571 [Pelosinus sp.]|jgi:uncharacterized integral membrane protein|nr:hypothetical protein [Pelosinus sp.]